MRAHQPDKNAKEIKENLERAGFSFTFVRAVGDVPGIPDAVVGRKRLTHLLELKSPKGRLSDEQVLFMRRFKGCVHVAFSSWEAILLLEECEAGRQ